MNKTYNEILKSLLSDIQHLEVSHNMMNPYIDQMLVKYKLMGIREFIARKDVDYDILSKVKDIKLDDLYSVLDECKLYMILDETIKTLKLMDDSVVDNSAYFMYMDSVNPINIGISDEEMLALKNATMISSIEDYTHHKNAEDKKLIGMVSGPGRSAFFEKTIVDSITERDINMLHVTNAELAHVDFLKELERDITESMCVLKSTPKDYPNYTTIDAKDIRKHDLANRNHFMNFCKKK